MSPTVTLDQLAELTRRVDTLEAFIRALAPADQADPAAARRARIAASGLHLVEAR